MPTFVITFAIIKYNSNPEIENLLEVAIIQELNSNVPNDFLVYIIHLLP